MKCVGVGGLSMSRRIHHNVNIIYTRLYSSSTARSLTPICDSTAYESCSSQVRRDTEVHGAVHEALRHCDQ